jgi:hypothetical protein
MQMRVATIDNAVILGSERIMVSKEGKDYNSENGQTSQTGQIGGFSFPITQTLDNTLVLRNAIMKNHSRKNRLPKGTACEERQQYYTPC